MNAEKMGQFIAESRKAKHMTQKELASKLNITDKAVSKWERGLSFPDISILTVLADSLNVTVSELLNGEKKSLSEENTENSMDNVLDYAKKSSDSRIKSLNNICFAVFSVLILVGIAVCAICDAAISGGFTWSLISISSMIFSWIILFPSIKFGSKGITASLMLLSVFIIPFLAVLNELIETNDMIILIGTRVSGISILYIWFVYLMFKILKTRKLLASSIALLTLTPIQVLINIVVDFTLCDRLPDPIIDVWDIVSAASLAAVALSLWLADFLQKRKVEK